MNNTAYLKCDCEHCGNPIQFPVEAADTTVDCPHCSAKTLLMHLEPIDSSPEKVSAVGVLNSFLGGVAKTKPSFLYQFGLVLVSIVMILLPLIYVGLVCLAGWGVYLYATHFTFLLKSATGGVRVYIFKLMIYIAPLFVGTILLFFLVKPLFARRPRSAQPLALNPALEPAVYAFIAKICDLVGAPMPKRIDLDCNLNASASFRRGMLSFFGDDMVLTLGVPLIAGLNMQQLAGVVAHEFGHFTQGFGMRLSYVIRSVNGWFARVVYERDAWDVMLEEMSAEAEDWRWMILVGCARAGVWCSRQILFLLMLFGHGVSSFLLRQMEYDADTYETRLVGSQAFEETCQRMHVLGALLKPTYNGLKVGFTQSRELPDDFSSLLLKHDSGLAPEKRTQLQDTMGLEKTSLFHTHPSNGDRIRASRQMQEPGVFQLKNPASELFNNFEVVSKQVTQLHYSDDLGIPFAAIKLVPVHQEKPVSKEVANPLTEGIKDIPLTPGRLRIRLKD
ncbi:MAG: hypothetical protein JWM68_563 [Verrucomicrobiales bacterium]|nr:hypothetical protein [Verrucomicrobiales bacterium]